jgi:hypothetical protein
MAPPEPPRRGSPLGPITEVNAARGPHTPAPPPDDVTTSPPPAPDRREPPRQYRAPRPAAVPAQRPDLTEEPERDSGHIAADGLFRQYEVEHERAEHLAEELAAARRPPAPEATRPPSERAVRKAQLHVALVKLLGAATVAATALATYLSVTAHTQIEPRVDNQAEKTRAVQAAATTDHDDLMALRSFVRAEAAQRECVESQMASALLRYAGHRVSGVGADVEWLEQSLSASRPKVLWEHAAWYPTTPCAARPKPP